MRDMTVLKDDFELLAHIKRLKFVVDPKLDPKKTRNARSHQRELVEYFVETYQDTDQDTVLFAAEAFIVIRMILSGQRPVRLVHLTEFEGERKPTKGRKK